MPSIFLDSEAKEVKIVGIVLLHLGSLHSCESGEKNRGKYKQIRRFLTVHFSGVGEIHALRIMASETLQR